MSLVDDMINAVQTAATGDADGFEPRPKCEHLRSGLNFYCFITEDPEQELLCRRCFEEACGERDHCATCGRDVARDEDIFYCFMIRDHFGASAVQDIFVTGICTDCGVHAPEGARTPGSWILERGGQKIMLIMRGLVARAPLTDPPQPDQTEKQRDRQEKKLQGVFNKLGS